MRLNYISVKLFYSRVVITHTRAEFCLSWQWVTTAMLSGSHYPSKHSLFMFIYLKLIFDENSFDLTELDLIIFCTFC